MQATKKPGERRAFCFLTQGCSAHMYTPRSPIRHLLELLPNTPIYVLYVIGITPDPQIHWGKGQRIGIHDENNNLVPS